MSRPEKDQREGFIPKEEAPRKDEPYSPEERDDLYNTIFEQGFATSILYTWSKGGPGRSLKATERQWELILYYKEANNIIETYLPSTIRHDRRGLRFGAAEKEILRKHTEDGVPVEHTARICMRNVESVIEFLEQQKQNRQAPEPEI